MQLTKRSPSDVQLGRNFGFMITRDMTQTMSFMVGALLISTGLVDLFFPAYLEMNLSVMHSILIAAVGGALIYSGFQNNSRIAYITCLVTGLFFALFSAVGFIFGERTNAFVRYDATDDHLLNIAGFNALGTFDHSVHAVIAVVLLLGAVDWYRHHRMDSSVARQLPDVYPTPKPSSWGRE